MGAKPSRQLQKLWAAGFKRCTRCKTIKHHGLYGKDKSRPDGLCATCEICRAGLARRGRLAREDADRTNPATGRHGPAPNEFVSGDKRSARQRVNQEIKAGALPNPNDLPCTDCGHTGAGRRHEYDHYLGYDAEHFLDVQPVCSRRHHRRDNPKAQQTHCIHGHEFTAENTITKPNGKRQCRECSRRRDRDRQQRRKAARAARKEAQHGNNNKDLVD